MAMKYKIFFELFIILDLYLHIFPFRKLYPFVYKFSNITLKIKGKGNKNILGYDEVDKYYFNKAYYPKEIHINGKKKDSVNYSYYFDEEYNLVELIWNNNIKSCRQMLRRCVDITEIDFSNFDISEVNDTSSMFIYCDSLTSLNLTNFDTSKVKDFGFMFHCCYSLTSLDLSNFDTFNVKRMDYMFQGCANLEFINLKNFEKSSLSSPKNMFEKVPENAVIYINEKCKKILSSVNNIKCHNIVSSDKCSNDTIYKYEYNGKCYNSCISL